MGKPEISIVVLWLVTLLNHSASAVARPQDDKTSANEVTGDWRGQSACVIRSSSCHDEDSFYHIAPLAKTPGWVSLAADKIVDGKAVRMGVIECIHDANKHTLRCELPNGTLQFDVQPDTIRGTMNLADGTLWRKINLIKVSPQVRKAMRFVSADHANTSINFHCG